MDNENPICVYRPCEEWQGEMIVQFLRDNHIEGFLSNRSSVALWGDGSSPFSELEILVPAKDKDAAVALIDEYLQIQAELSVDELDEDDDEDESLAPN